jgi:hypothetical protein
MEELGCDDYGMSGQQLESVRCRRAAVLINKASCYTAVAVTLYSLQ